MLTSSSVATASNMPMNTNAPLPMTKFPNARVRRERRTCGV
jgi:hypothetical protein